MGRVRIRVQARELEPGGGEDYAPPLTPQNIIHEKLENGYGSTAESQPGLGICFGIDKAQTDL